MHSGGGHDGTVGWVSMKTVGQRSDLGSDGGSNAVQAYERGRCGPGEPVAHRKIQLQPSETHQSRNLPEADIGYQQRRS